MGSWSVPLCGESVPRIARCMGSWSVPLCHSVPTKTRIIHSTDTEARDQNPTQRRIVFGNDRAVSTSESGSGLKRPELTSQEKLKRVHSVRTPQIMQSECHR